MDCSDACYVIGLLGGNPQKGKLKNGYAFYLSIKMNELIRKTLSLCLLVCIGQTAFAYKFYVDGIYYNKLNDDSVEVTYTSTSDRIDCNSYTGNIVIPSTVTYEQKEYAVTSIGYSAFNFCASLKSVTIPSSVTSIGSKAFRKCTGLTSITIPSSVTSIGYESFYECTGLTSITIPNSVTSIESETFSYCTHLTSITIPTSVKSIGEHAFYGTPWLSNQNDGVIYINNILYTYKGEMPINTSIEVKEGTVTITAYAFESYTNLTSVTIPSSVTSIGDRAFEDCTGLTSVTIPSSVTSIGDRAFYGCTKLWSANYGTPTFSTFHASVKNLGFNGVDVGLRLYGGNIIEGETITGLRSGTSYSIYPVILLSNGQYSELDCYSFKTKSISASITSKIAPTSFSGLFSVNDKGDAIEEVVSKSIEGISATFDGDAFATYGLEPNTKYTLKYIIKLSDGRNIVDSETLTTSALELTTLQPKVVSSMCAIAAATTNISDEETSVGFQWKKYEAPESLKPNEGYTAIYDGQLEGYIKNLQPTYYNVRAFYKSSAGNYYYGDWVTFDQTDFSYFEPTVHTYDATNITYNSAKLKGYVMQGTDEVANQGFEYWKSGASATKAMVAYAPSATDSVSTVLATGQVMTATLENLQPSTRYCCRAFVTTTSGTTYGEEQTFVTTENMTGIYGVQTDAAEPTIVGIYDIQGRKFSEPVKGLNIVRYSNGMCKKVFVK